MEETELGSVHGSQTTGGEREEPRRLDRGEVVGRYVVVEVLGVGGMGVVYAAYDPELDRRVALKLLNPRGAGSRAEKGRARLLREAQALAKLSHPNVVSVHDVGEHEGQVFVAMEFIDGVTLKAWIRQGPHPWREVVDVLSRAARGLMAAHAKEMTHRDFKPDNVMLRGEGLQRRVVVMDFGLASTPSTSAEFDATASASLASNLDLDSLTRTGAVMGTPAYMAPEQHAGHTDSHSDQFSFCVTLYEALYGSRPFRGDTLPEQVAAVTTGEVEPAPARSPVPRWLREVVLRGLAADPEARWPSMQALLQALHADPSRKRWALAGGAVVVGGLVAVVGYGAVRDRQLEAACRDEGRAAEAIWGTEQRTRIAQAFQASPLPYADDVWTRAQPRLDASAAAWSEGRERSCKARAVLPEPLQQVQDACFESRARRLSTVVELLSAPDNDTIHRAPHLAEVDSGDCEDPRWLRNAPPVPVDPRARAARVAVLNQINDGIAQQGAGHYAQAIETLRAALDAATDLDDPRLVVWAQLRLGYVLLAAKQPKDGAQALENAYFGAMTLADASVAVHAAQRLIDAHGTLLSNQAVGRRWARHAGLLVESLDDDVERARLDYQLAQVEFSTGQNARALELGQSALAVFRLHFGEHATATLSAKKLLVGVYDRELRAEEAVALSRELVEARTAMSGPRHPETLAARNNLAAALISLQAFEEAELNARTAAEAEGPADLATASALDNLSLAVSLQGRKDEALKYHRRALALRRELLPADHVQLANTLVNSAALHFGLDKLDEALAAANEAREIYARNGGPDSPLLVNPSRIAGSILALMERHPESIEAFEVAHRLHRARLGETHDETVRALVELTMAQLRNDAPQVALTLLQPLFAEGVDRTTLAPDLFVSLHTVYGRVQLQLGATEAGRAALATAVQGAESKGCCKAWAAIARVEQARDRWREGQDKAEARAAAKAAIESLTDAADAALIGEPERVQAWLEATTE